MRVHHGWCIKHWCKFQPQFQSYTADKEELSTIDNYISNNVQTNQKPTDRRTEVKSVVCWLANLQMECIFPDQRHSSFLFIYPSGLGTDFHENKESPLSCCHCLLVNKDLINMAQRQKMI